MYPLSSGPHIRWRIKPIVTPSITVSNAIFELSSGSGVIRAWGMRKRENGTLKKSIIRKKQWGYVVITRVRWVDECVEPVVSGPNPKMPSSFFSLFWTFRVIVMNYPSNAYSKPRSVPALNMGSPTLGTILCTMHHLCYTLDLFTERSDDIIASVYIRVQFLWDAASAMSKCFAGLLNELSRFFLRLDHSNLVCSGHIINRITC